MTSLFLYCRGLEQLLPTHHNSPHIGACSHSIPQQLLFLCALQKKKQLNQEAAPWKECACINATLGFKMYPHVGPHISSSPVIHSRISPLELMYLQTLSTCPSLRPFSTWYLSNLTLHLPQKNCENCLQVHSLCGRETFLLRKEQLHNQDDEEGP